LFACLIFAINFLCHQLHETRGDPICTKEDTPEALKGRLQLLPLILLQFLFSTKKKGNTAHTGNDLLDWIGVLEYKKLQMN
jgi:hypothetical protein